MVKLKTFYRQNRSIIISIEYINEASLTQNLHYQLNPLRNLHGDRIYTKFQIAWILIDYNFQSDNKCSQMSGLIYMQRCYRWMEISDSWCKSEL